MPLLTLTIDFDDQKEYVRRFGAPRQSTLILHLLVVVAIPAVLPAVPRC